MRISQVELRKVSLPLVRPFRTSSSYRQSITPVLVRVQAESGQVGWGECSAPVDPYYCAETTGTCWHILKEFLVPSLLEQDWREPGEIAPLFGPIKGNRFARAGLEMACIDAWCRENGLSVARWLGGTRARIESGVSLGIETDLGRLFAIIDQHLAEGYARIKLKIAPGHDLNLVRSVRSAYPSLKLQVDANSAYTLTDTNTLRQLDDLQLLLIEQPLGDDDLIDHAELQKQLVTPLCLDESLHSLDDVRKALQIQACRVVNIKPGRVGGLVEARRIHDYCQARTIPVWCGGMHEFGIGRAANVALASLPGFSLPGDVSGSSKYFEHDLVTPAIEAERGTIFVYYEQPGLGVEPQLDRIEHHTTAFWSSAS